MAARAELPSGTVTFLFTDIEGSTKLLQTIPEQLSTRTFSSTSTTQHEPMSPMWIPGPAEPTTRLRSTLVPSAEQTNSIPA